MNNNILNIYLHGSQVYGTATEKSDYDYIVILEDNTPEPNLITYFPNQKVELIFYSKSEWVRRAQENDCDFLECYFLPEDKKIKETFIPEFKLVKEKIRSNFSAKASNSWVKCKKKLTVEKDYNPYIGKKSLWHSLRLIRFGIQILKYGKITDYSELNYLYKEIAFNESNDWEYYKSKYQPLYNSYKTEFRLAEEGSIILD